MHSEKDPVQHSNCGGANSSDTPSIALLNRRLGISPAPRMLTPSEIDLLRQCGEEVVRVTERILANKDDASGN